MSKSFWHDPEQQKDITTDDYPYSRWDSLGALHELPKGKVPSLLEYKAQNSDTLSLKYPKLGDVFSDLKSQGFEDDELDKAASKVEYYLNFHKSQKDIDNLMGRTEESQSLLVTKRKQDENAFYVGIKNTGIWDPDELEKRLSIAEAVGVNPSLLLRYPDLYKHYESQVQYTEGLGESITDAYNAYKINRRRSQLGVRVMNEGMNDDFKSQLSELEEEARQYQRPIKPTLAGKAAGSATQIVSQFIMSIPEQGIGALSLGAIGGAIGALSPIIGGAGAGATLGANIGRWLGMAKDTYDLEAGGAYLDMIAKEGTDPAMAKKWAKTVGVINTGIELVTLPMLGKAMGPAGKAVLPKPMYGQIKNIFSKVGPKLMADKTFGQILLDRGKDWVIGSTGEGLEEAFQEAVGIFGEYMVQKGGAGNWDEFNFEDTLEQMAEAGGEAFLGSLVVGAGGQVISLVGSTPRNKPNHVSESQGDSEPNRGVASEGKPAVVLFQEKDLKAHFTDDELINLKVDPLRTESGEVIVSDNEFASMIKAKPGFAESIKSTLRYGANGLTEQEKQEKIERALMNKKTDGQVEVEQKIYDQAIEAGRTKSEAKRLSMVVGEFSKRMAGLTGLSEQEIADIRIVRGQNEDKAGGYSVEDGGTGLITLYKAANESTTFHEFGHHMFAVLEAVANRDWARQDLIESYLTVIQDYETQQGHEGDFGQLSEHFARGFETYLAQGKAPSKKLTGAFQTIKTWLINIYHNVGKALGFDLSPEMTSVYDMMLASPEQKRSMETIGERVTRKEASDMRLKELSKMIKELVVEVFESGQLGDKEGKRFSLSQANIKLKEQLKQIKDKQHKLLQQTAADAKAVDTLNKKIKRLNKMRNAEDISWDSYQRINAILANFSVKKESLKAEEKRARRAQANPEGLSLDEKLELDATNVRHLTEAQFDRLYRGISAIYHEGRVEYAQWVHARNEQAMEIRKELLEDLKKTKPYAESVINGPADLNKKYSGIMAGPKELKDRVKAETLSPDRFYDWLGGGHGLFNSNFSKWFGTKMNEGQREFLRHCYERKNKIGKYMKENGIQIKDLGTIILTLGETNTPITVEMAMGYYAAAQNDRSRRAIIHGNLTGFDGEQVLAEMMDNLDQKYKDMADMILKDFEDNTLRYYNAMVKNFNHGFDLEKNYSPMQRLAVFGNLTVDTEKTIEQGEAYQAILQRFDLRHSISRQDIEERSQKPINTHLVSMWLQSIEQQERMINFAPIALPLAKAITGEFRTEITTRFGKPAWSNLVNMFNLDVVGRDITATQHSSVETWANRIRSTSAIHYLAFNLSVILKQIPSFFKFIGTGHMDVRDIFPTMIEFMSSPKKFLDSVFEKSPEVRERNASFMYKEAVNTGPLHALTRDIGSKGMEGIGALDRIVASIGWELSYRHNKRTMSEVESIEGADRDVRLTQQPASAREASWLYRNSNPLLKTFLMFTSETQSTFNQLFYDQIEALKRGDIGHTLSVLLGFSVMSIILKAMQDGLPNEDDDESWFPWLAEATGGEWIGTIPIIGKSLQMWGTGRYSNTGENFFIAPFKIFNKKSDTLEEKTWDAIATANLLNPLPQIPVLPLQGMRKIYDAGRAIIDEDAGFYDPLKYVLGMKVKRR